MKKETKKDGRNKLKDAVENILTAIYTIIAGVIAGVALGYVDTYMPFTNPVIRWMIGTKIFIEILIAEELMYSYKLYPKIQKFLEGKFGLEDTSGEEE